MNTDKILIICTIPRSGSHAFASLLNSTPYFGSISPTSLNHIYAHHKNIKFHEIVSNIKFNFISQSHLYGDNDFDDEFVRYIKEEIKPKIGIKCYPVDIPIIMKFLENQSLSLHGVKWIWLHRENIIKQCISYIRAQFTEKWASREIIDEDIAFNIKSSEFIHHVPHVLQVFTALNQWWRDFFSEQNISYLNIGYEKHILNDKDHLNTVKLVLDFLEIKYDDTLSVSCDMAKQSTDWNNSMYLEVIQHFLKNVTYGFKG